jgi:hypothetical protein
VAEPRRWARITAYAGGVTLLLLTLQYLVGLWTNVYAPAQFGPFDSYPPYPSPALEVHILNGILLGVVSLAALVLAALSKQLRLIVPALVLLIAVFVAGEFGFIFVNSAPNNPIDSFGMGAMFIVALFSAAALLMLSRGTRPAEGPQALAPVSSSGAS